MNAEKITAAALSTPAARLRWARENRSSHKTASDAARAHGWPISTYLGHENGDRAPSQGSARRYGVAYRVAWHWILGGGDLPAEERLNPFNMTDPFLNPVSDAEFAALWAAYPHKEQLARIVRLMKGFTPFQVGVVAGYTMRMSEEKDERRALQSDLHHAQIRSRSP